MQQYLGTAAESHCEQQWTPELAEAISQAEVCQFVDAAVGASPGLYRTLPVTARTGRIVGQHASYFFRIYLASRRGTLQEAPGAGLLRHDYGRWSEF